MKYKVKYTRAIVIVHGKSEEQICKYIRSNLKISLEIYKNPKSSIQITDLQNLFGNEIFKTRKSFLKKYDDIEIDKKGKKLLNFKIFIIMDTDDCTDAQKNNYIDGTMFKTHWANEYIVPIYNNRNLEDVAKKIGIEIQKKSEYIKIFPTDRKYIQQSNDLIQVEEMAKTLKKYSITNLDEFFEYCLNCTSSYKKI